MSDKDREISFRLQRRMDDTEGDRPPVVFLNVGQDFALEMLPNPFTPRSTISRRAFNDLVSRGILSSDPEVRLFLRDLTITGRPVPDVEVSVGRAASFLNVDGFLGYDFFEQFAEIHFNTRTFVMTLVRDS